LTLHGNALPYVSRGGLKLAKGLEVFPVNLEGKTVLDIGASTGGFTDCALQNGAAKVVAVDVGYGQLDWKLRQDDRVLVLEKTNARYLKPEDIGGQVDFVTIDVAFISLSKIFPVLADLLKPEGQGIALIKPQFEAGRDKVGKKGVVKDPRIHQEVIEKVIVSAKENHLTPLGLDFSPIKGPEGNIECLLWFGYQTLLEARLNELTIDDLVMQSTQVLKGDNHDT
jgi:23S rRNA (cytidine1920-2'-O)/16S rRNA (cytidine1409-2'-O)-methyltransferase